MTPAHETTTFPSVGTELCGFVWRSEAGATAPWVIMSHGLTNSHRDAPLFDATRAALLARGFSVFMFDYYGSGTSPGSFEDKTWGNQRRNLADAISYVHAGLASPAIKIGLFGRSVGGTLCAFHVNDSRIAGSVLLSPPVKLELTFGGYRSRAVDGYVHMPSEVERSGQIRGEWKLPVEFFTQLRSTEAELAAAAKGAGNVLVTHGLADGKVLPENSLSLFDILANPKQYIAFDSGDHYYHGCEADVVAAATSWLVTHLKPTDSET